MKFHYKRKYAGTFGVDELTKLNAETLHAVLATAHNDMPHASLVAYAFDNQEDVFIFLTPKGTSKYSNILLNPNVSLLIDRKTNTDKDYQYGEAYTFLGTASSLRKSRRRERLLTEFLYKHPKLKGFSREKSTAVLAVEIKTAYKVTRFQEIYKFQK